SRVKYGHTTYPVVELTATAVSDDVDNNPVTPNVGEPELEQVCPLPVASAAVGPASSRRQYANGLVASTVVE
ncbi:MAG: hypothetical protein ACLPVY_12610, partial [Acidimicrobiia bacterium]